MRDYSKVSPQFWYGKTGKALKAGGQEAVIVALYLMTCQHANMLGIYHLSIQYIVADTGLSLEGATKGLARAIEAGFCMFDEASEVVWVMEMASYQIGVQLDVKDLRCKGVQREYDGLPENPYLTAFYERYAEAFLMTSCRGKPKPLARPSKGPTKPRAGTGAGAGDVSKPTASQSAEPTAPKVPACPFDSVVSLYHEVLPELPSVRVMDDERKQGLTKFWKFILTSKKTDGSRRALDANDALTWLRGYFERARLNDFVMNRTARSAGHEKWQASLDYLCTSKGLKQVVEKTVEPVA